MLFMSNNVKPTRCSLKTLISLSHTHKNKQYTNKHNFNYAIHWIRQLLLYRRWLYTVQVNYYFNFLIKYTVLVKGLDKLFLLILKLYFGWEMYTVPKSIQNLIFKLNYWAKFRYLKNLKCKKFNFFGAQCSYHKNYYKMWKIIMSFVQIFDCYCR